MVTPLLPLLVLTLSGCADGLRWSTGTHATPRRAVLLAPRRATPTGSTDGSASAVATEEEKELEQYWARYADAWQAPLRALDVRAALAAGKRSRGG